MVCLQTHSKPSCMQQSPYQGSFLRSFFIGVISISSSMCQFPFPFELFSSSANRFTCDLVPLCSCGCAAQNERQESYQNVPPCSTSTITAQVSKGVRCACVRAWTRAEPTDEPHSFATTILSTRNNDCRWASTTVSQACRLHFDFFPCRLP